jgi:hypothetical protein
LKGRRDSIPALRREIAGNEIKPEKISRFCLERKMEIHIFVVPKAGNKVL